MQDVVEEKGKKKKKIHIKCVKNLVSVIKNRSNTFPSGVVDTFTFLIMSSSSQRTSVTSVKVIFLKTINTSNIKKFLRSKEGPNSCN